MDQRLALLDAGYTIQAQIAKLEKGLPIALSKAHSMAAQARKRKEYNEKIKALRIQLKAINDAIYN